jgi:hypothetical protein
LAIIAVLLIVLGAVIAGLLALRIDERVPVLVARNNITVGQQITAEDLSVARMASEGVIGQYAGVAIPSGRLIDRDMLGKTGLLTPGKAAVGVALEPGRFPAGGLTTGDTVQVVRSVEGEGKVIAATATIGTVDEPGDSTFGSGGSDTTVITIVVSERLAPAVAAASMADQLSLVLLRRGDLAGAG